MMNASYSPGKYNVLGSLQSQVEAKEKLLVQQGQEYERIGRAMADTREHITEIAAAIAVLAPKVAP